MLETKWWIHKNKNFVLSSFSRNSFYSLTDTWWYIVFSMIRYDFLLRYCCRRAWFQNVLCVLSVRWHYIYFAVKQFIPYLISFSHLYSIVLWHLSFSSFHAIRRNEYVWKNVYLYIYLEKKTYIHNTHTLKNIYVRTSIYLTYHCSCSLLPSSTQHVFNLYSILWLVYTFFFLSFHRLNGFLPLCFCFVVALVCVCF